MAGAAVFIVVAVGRTGEGEALLFAVAVSATLAVGVRVGEIVAGAHPPGRRSTSTRRSRKNRRRTFRNIIIFPTVLPMYGQHANGGLLTV
jgi:hypothetical protein